MNSIKKKENRLPISTYRTYPMWLENTYAILRNTPITYLEGYLEEDPENDEKTDQERQDAQRIYAEDMKTKITKLFVKGTDMYVTLATLLKMNEKIDDMCNFTICLVNKTFRDIYIENKRNLSEEESYNLEMRTKNQPQPVFKSIFEYKRLSKYAHDSIPMYQLFNDIMPYDVINVPIKYFVECINNAVPITISIAEIKVTLQIDYDKKNLWDPYHKKFINYINPELFC